VYQPIRKLDGAALSLQVCEFGAALPDPCVPVKIRQICVFVQSVLKHIGGGVFCALFKLH